MPEILIPIVLLVFVFVAYLFGRDYRARDKAKAIEAGLVLDRIVIELEKFYFVCGRYPTSDEGLQILTKSACDHNFTLKPVNLKDPWDTDISYLPNEKLFLITSFGSDGKPGGSGYEKDIVAPKALKVLLEK